MTEYIYLADLGADWTVTHPEALARLPEGYSYVWAGQDGAWAEPDAAAEPVSTADLPW